MHRTYEQQIQTLADIRVLVAHLQCELQKANREGRELFVELWSDFQKPREEQSCMCRSVRHAENSAPPTNTVNGVTGKMQEA